LYFFFKKKKKKKKIEVINCITINIISIGFYKNNDYQVNVVKKFNKYSKENNLEIDLKLNIFTEDNYTGSYFSYGDVIESVLKKSKTKYDIYTYDNAFVLKFGSYFLDLKEYLSEDLIKLYNKKIISYTCIYKNKLIALVCFFFFNIFNFYLTFYINLFIFIVLNVILLKINICYILAIKIKL